MTTIDVKCTYCDNPAIWGYDYAYPRDPYDRYGKPLNSQWACNAHMVNITMALVLDVSTADETTLSYQIVRLNPYNSDSPDFCPECWYCGAGHCICNETDNS
jgi:hypothetical protein